MEQAAKQRADALDRAAQERSDGLIRQANQILESATKQVNGSVSEIDSLLVNLNQCLRQIGETISQMDSSFHTIEPLQPLSRVIPSAPQAPAPEADTESPPILESRWAAHFSLSVLNRPPAIDGTIPASRRQRPCGRPR